MDVDALVSEATARIAGAADSAALEEIRIEALGRKAPLVQALRELASLPPDERRARGDELNRARRALEGLVERPRPRAPRRASSRSACAPTGSMSRCPASRTPRGYSHLIEQTQARHPRRVRRVRVQSWSTGPRSTSIHYNFDALNHAPTHPSRQVTDTFYVADDVVLRTHTSPVQIRTMEAGPPPVYMATAGRCYRRDTPDATHTAMFTQIEGLVVDRGITLAHLKGTLLGFARAIFGAEREVRLRPHFFPFTEPSVEVDVSCFNCARDGSPCRVCKGGGLGRDPRRRHGRPEPLRLRRRLRPRGGVGVRVRPGRRARRRPAPRHPRHPAPLGERPALHWSSSDEGARLVAARLRLVRHAPAGAGRAHVDDGDEARGAAPPRRARRRSTSTGWAACSRASSTRTPTGSACAPSTSATASPSRSSAARRTSRRARPSPSPSRARFCPTAPSFAWPSCAASSRTG